jgi:hypothetical protein
LYGTFCHTYYTQNFSSLPWPTLSNQSYHIKQLPISIELTGCIFCMKPLISPQCLYAEGFFLSAILKMLLPTLNLVMLRMSEGFPSYIKAIRILSSLHLIRLDREKHILPNIVSLASFLKSCHSLQSDLKHDLSTY